MKTKKGKSLYLMQADNSGAIKIGKSANPERRVKQLQTGCPFEIRLIASFPEKGDLEKRLHKRLWEYRINPLTNKKTRGEWFDFSCMGNLPDWITETLDLDMVNTWWEKP